MAQNGNQTQVVQPNPHGATKPNKLSSNQTQMVQPNHSGAIKRVRTEQDECESEPDHKRQKVKN